MNLKTYFLSYQYPSSDIGLDSNRIVKWCVYGMTAFPIIDYGLRLNVFHGVGSIWDKVILLILGFVAIRRYAGGYLPNWFTWQKYASWFILYGFALMFAGLNNPIASIQGFRIDIYYMLFTFVLPFVVSPKDVPKLL